MNENEIVTIILDAAFKIRKKLGPGLFESVYEAVLQHELVNSYKLEVRRQCQIPVQWKEVSVELGFRTDMIVDHKVIVELKSVESIAPVHLKQVLTYLRLTELKVGLIINFNEALLRNGIRR